MSCRIDQRGLLLYRGDNIDKLGCYSKLFLQRSLEDIEICTLKIFAEKLRRNFDRKRRVHKRDRLDRPEPHCELLRINVLLNEIQTVVPNRYVSFLNHV